MIKHTPGPWVVHEQGDANDFCLLTTDGKWVIAFLQNGELMLEKQRANARLIATAPDLADLARNVAGLDDTALANATLHTLRTWIIEYRAQARAAIAKAEGGNDVQDHNSKAR